MEKEERQSKQLLLQTLLIVSSILIGLKENVSSNELDWFVLFLLFSIVYFAYISSSFFSKNKIGVFSLSLIVSGLFSFFISKNLSMITPLSWLLGENTLAVLLTFFLTISLNTSELNGYLLRKFKAGRR